MKTSKNSTRQLTLDELISSQEGSPANPTPSPVSERERRTSATCGPRCCALFENAPRATSWGKTFSALLVGMEGWYSKRCALTWKLKGTPYNRSYFQLVGSVRHTKEIECFLLRTENANTDTIPAQTKHCAEPVKADVTTNYGLLPTPTVSDSKGGRSGNKPRKDHNPLTNSLKDGIGYRMHTTSTTWLNPLFVEEMMGFPKNWTALPFQSGDEKA